jgi:hypothetical protein
VLPAQTVFAVSTDGSRYFTVETSWGQSAYTMVGVVPGDYHVLSDGPIGLGGYDAGSVVSSDARTGAVLHFRAAYTKFVPCGLSISCPDHGLLIVHVAAGQTTSGIDPVDWYDDAGYYIRIPDQYAGHPRPGVIDRVSVGALAFGSERAAGAYLGDAWTVSRSVGSAAECPPNIACSWVTGVRDGQSAAYVELAAGSNGVIQSCAIYLIRSAAGWIQLGPPGQPTDACDTAGPPFPTVGRSGVITMPIDESGCVRVHISPSIGARVVACLAVGTRITLDDGPAYVVPTPPVPQTDAPYTLAYWWHIAGRGWVVDTYVVTYHYG